MKTLNVLSVLFALVLAGGCTTKEELTTTDAELDLRGKNPVEKHFTGVIDYVRVAPEELSISCECTEPAEIGNYFIGTGNITHMGNSTSEVIPCITLNYYEGNVIGYNILAQCNTFVAANGDELFFEVEPYTMSLDFNCFCQFTGSSNVSFNGGTGRFADATGTGTVDVVNDLASGVVSNTLDALITY